MEDYPDSMALFEEIYFDKNGNFAFDAHNAHSQDSDKYWDLGKDNTLGGDGRSKIVGRSFFTPRIRRQPVCDEHTPSKITGYKYFLTLDYQGMFDYHFDAFLQSNQDCIKEIDISNMSKEEILIKVNEILHMSNEQVMELFNIQSTYSTKVKLELLVDDIISSYFSKKEEEIIQKIGNPEWGIRVESKKHMVKQETVGYDPQSKSNIYINPTSNNGGPWEERICYNVLTPKEPCIAEIRIAFDDEHTYVTSELGQFIYSSLKDRFTERQIEETHSPEKLDGLPREALIKLILEAQKKGFVLDQEIAQLKNKGEII